MNFYNKKSLILVTVVTVLFLILNVINIGWNFLYGFGCEFGGGGMWCSVTGPLFFISGLSLMVGVVFFLLYLKHGSTTSKVFVKLYWLFVFLIIALSFLVQSNSFRDLFEGTNLECALTSHRYGKTSCYSNLAKKLNDITICNKLNSHNRSSCTAYFAPSLKDPDLCGGMDWCIYRVAVISNDPNICNLINNHRSFSRACYKDSRSKNPGSYFGTIKILNYPEPIFQDGVSHGGVNLTVNQGDKDAILGSVKIVSETRDISIESIGFSLMLPNYDPSNKSQEDFLDNFRLKLDGIYLKDLPKHYLLDDPKYIFEFKEGDLILEKNKPVLLTITADIPTIANNNNNNNVTQRYITLSMGSIISFDGTIVLDPSNADFLSVKLE